MSPQVALHDPKLVVWNVKLSYVPANPRPDLYHMSRSPSRFYTLCPGPCPRPGFTPSPSDEHITQELNLFRKS